MRYRTFIRTWWKIVDGKQVPHMGRKTYTGNTYATPDGARKECDEYNSSHKPGPKSRKMKFESF